MGELSVPSITKTKLLIMAVLFFVSTSLVVALVNKNNIVSAAVGGPTCNVPADYATIQLAVDAAGCNTVKVAAGSYTENVTINRTVNLKGAKANVNVNGRTFSNPSESTVTGLITVNAPNVTVNGFSFTNPDQTLGVLVKTAGSGTKVKNNFVSGVGNASYTEPTVGIYLEYGPDNVKVTGNKVSNVKSGTKSAQGMLIGDSTSADPSLGIVVDSNEFTDIASTSRGGYGVQVNNGSKTPAELPSAVGYTEVKIRGNEINNLSGLWVHAIGLEGETPNAVVRYNKVSNLNALTPNEVGVYFEANQFFFTAKVNRNSLDVSNSTYGIAVEPSLVSAYPSLQVDGECNWWGHKSGPGAIASGSGSLVGPGVDYSPWLKSSNLDGRCGDRHDESDDDDHHGDKNCKKDDRRDWDYRD